jgi:urea transport system permease protein
MAKCVALIIFAISVDLLWGYTGILSLGQAVSFGIGAYIAAISNNLVKGMPSYMKTYGLTEVPFALRPLQNPVVGIVLAILIPAALAFLVGRLLLSGQVKGVFISLITMALANVLQLYTNNAQRYTGGSNGVGNISRPSLFGNTLTIEQNYYFVTAIVVLVFLFCLFLTSSKFGKVLTAIKTNENRMAFIGYNVTNYKVFIYVIAAALAAVAGILYARTSGMISPTVTGIKISTLAVIWVAVGGRGNLTGAVLGCLLLNWMERFLANVVGNYWELIVGIILLAIVFLVPDGIVGAALKWKPGRKAKGGVSDEGTGAGTG